ncbi:tRNA (guanine-N(1)-)-methyltransferase [Alteracholeplasma palmae J233]|uniref:tRNA (guanine-N(1)-)-methyltransferase n=1 Tax=Alteracholeplasma palmae (strain ATCC 49389 / J233) TaxID=1318466 RepID=U4KNQ0_ALTPJ|nr:tRNA (guanosine(37)-N1)-methyltransferase TrmD [Alteracholeplasma palmae]CCV63830.1 tRNA (guanine-N(1)-)-methyltransferase [Alteracholeplasma palmae J233]
MIVDIITIFPDFFDRFLETSIVKRAIEKGKLTVNIHDLRDYSLNKHKQIDDTPYGGGVGMLMTFPPFYECLQKIKTDNSKIIMLSPQGNVFDQTVATHYAQTESHLIILCGHYEGIDARILDYVDYEISIGDYVLTGGELASMIIVDAITRLLPGVINESSYLEDSHQNGLLKYPQYTKPENYKDHKVPEVLLSGHHENIRKWRETESLRTTYLKRPDLLEKKQLTKEELKILEKIKKETNK